MSKLFPGTRRDVGKDLTRAHELLLQSGMIEQVSPGIWTLLPMGLRALRKVHDIIYKEYEEEGAQNLQLPILQARALWEKTGRWEKYIETKTMFTTSEYHYDAEYGLAPTAEEAVCFVASNNIESWRDMPVTLHQIGPKFRDEIRPRLGLLRGREFYMSDAYSFDRDEEGMKASFERYRAMYARIFDIVGLNKVIPVQAHSGDIGGSGSVEFMALNEEVGEDLLLACGDCSYGSNTEIDAGSVGDVCHECSVGTYKELRGIEIGHVFQLQKSYSEPTGVTFRDENDKEQVAWMGCYGIGTSRLLQAIIDQNHDEDGIKWPLSVAPFKISVVPVSWKDEVQKEMAEKAYEQLKENGLDVLLDDRDMGPGAKFKDSDLLGAPYRITIGRKAGEGIVEVKDRRSGEMEELPLSEAIEKVIENCK